LKRRGGSREAGKVEGLNVPLAQPHLTVAYGGGGLFGIAYLMGVAEALMDNGVALAAAPAVGTSAGAWAASAVSLGIRWATAISAIGDDVPRIPDPRGEARAPSVRVVVCELPRLRRVVLNGADYPVADLVAASSAVPGLLSPHRIDGHRYVDGGVRSMTSADRCHAAVNLLVITPMAGSMFGPAGRLMEQIMVREMRSWGLANPASGLWLIRPNAAIATLARRPDQLFDRSRAMACYPVAYEQGRRIRQQWLDGDGPA
jgi:predicted acylesterase/phospholipase RssA